MGANEFDEDSDYNEYDSDSGQQKQVNSWILLQRDWFVSMNLHYSKLCLFFGILWLMTHLHSGVIHRSSNRLWV